MASDSIIVTNNVDNRNWRRRRPWSDLPEELLRLVAELLSPVDRIRFRTVCKDWALTNMINPKLPWLICTRSFRHRTDWCFFEPFRQLPYVTEEEKGFKDMNIKTERPCWFPLSERISSRSGWTLLSKSFSEDSTAYSHYLYHPLSKNITSLPLPEQLQEQDCRFERLATFAASDSAVVVLLSIANDDSSRSLFFGVYSITNQTWKTYHAHPNPYFSHIHHVAYVEEEGNIYCYNREEGLLSSFHIPTQEWSLLLCNEKPALIPYRNFDEDFVAYDGHLHLVYLEKLKVFKDRDVEDKDMNFFAYYRRKLRLWEPLCEIFRYDWSDGAWKKMSSLEGGAIFFGNPSIGIPPGEETMMIANRVYYSRHPFFPPRFLVYGAGEGDGEEGGEKSDDLYLYKTYCQSWREGNLKPNDPPYISFIWMDPPKL